jgi:hypothetical protein
MFSLKQLLEEAFLLEEAVPDASPKDPFGKYLFAPLRDDVPEPKEPNTKREEDFLSALEFFYFDNKDKNLIEILPSLFSLAKKGKYTKFLVPPQNRLAYRFLQVDVEKASKILGVSIEKIESSPNMVPFYVTGCPDYVPISGRQLSSWTLDPEFRAMSDFAYTNDVFGPPKMVSIVLVAETSKNKFLLNPEELTKSGILPNISNFYYEMETIGIGPIKILEAAYVKFLRAQSNRLKYKIHRALLSALNLKQRKKAWRGPKNEDT